MNETNITTGGYVGSKMYTKNLAQAKTLAASAFGDLILTHREYLTNAVSNGYPSAGAWFDSTLELPNEIMMYGSLVFTPAGDGTVVVNRYTIGKTQLALFYGGSEYDLKSCNVLAQRYRFFGSFRSCGRRWRVRTAATLRPLYGVRPVFAIG